MSFTSAELAKNMAAGVIVGYLDRGQTHDQHIQKNPLFHLLNSKKKYFPGGKDTIEFTAVGTPGKSKTVSIPWAECHTGIKVTHTELKMSGISIVDNAPKNHTRREAVIIADLLNNKVDDMSEGYDKSLNEILWKSGSQNSADPKGLTYFLRDDPTDSVVIAGINQSTSAWWRNRASLLIDASDPEKQSLVNILEAEYLQLCRFGGMPDRFLVGSAFMAAYKDEARAKGNYTEVGFAKGITDLGIKSVGFQGIPLQYDPTLDSMGKSKYGYLLDSSKLQLAVMEGEDRVPHTPQRAADEYVYYSAITWTGALICKQRNAQGVYSIK